MRWRLGSCKVRIVSAGTWKAVDGETVRGYQPTAIAARQNDFISGRVVSGWSIRRPARLESPKNVLCAAPKGRLQYRKGASCKSRSLQLPGCTSRCREYYMHSPVVLCLE